MFDQPFLVGCPVSFSVSEWFSFDSKSKLSEAVATDIFLLQSEMCPRLHFSAIFEHEDVKEHTVVKL